MSKHSDTILDRIQSDFDPAIRAWPGTKQDSDIAHVRAILGSVAGDLARICPQSRELNHAINKLDEAAAWAERAIERHSIGGADRV